MANTRVTALIVAAGSGERMGSGLPKQYRALAGKAVLAHAVDSLASHPDVHGVRVVIGAGQEDLARKALMSRDVGAFIEGGATRSASVCAGLSAIDDDIVLIHDAARPFCPERVIDDLLAALARFEGATPVLPATDTLTHVRPAHAPGRIRPDRTLGQPIARDKIFRVQTPQAFRMPTLLAAIEDWRADEPTDETAFLTAKRIDVAAVEGDERLEKLTTTADWDRAEAMLAARLVPRTGMGFDVHGFAGDGPVMLGGIAVPHSRGLAGHSDADVVLHAITDALLGAAGLGDIGEHFPPSDPQWRGASSDRFLAHAADLVRSSGATIDHVDCTIIAEEPKVGPHRSAMKARIAAILGLQGSDVSIKATTTEGMGFTGRREGIAAQAVASIRTQAGR